MAAVGILHRAAIGRDGSPARSIPSERSASWWAAARSNGETAAWQSTRHRLTHAVATAQQWSWLNGHHGSMAITAQHTRPATAAQTHYCIGKDETMMAHCNSNPGWNHSHRTITAQHAHIRRTIMAQQWSWLNTHSHTHSTHTLVVAPSQLKHTHHTITAQQWQSRLKHLSSHLAAELFGEGPGQAANPVGLGGRRTDLLVRLWGDERARTTPRSEVIRAINIGAGL